MGDVSLNLSKNVLFRFDDICFSDGVGMEEDDVGLGNVTSGTGMGLDFIRFVIIWNGWIVVIDVGAAVAVAEFVDDDEEIVVGDKAK